MLNEFSELPQTSELSDTCLEDCLGEYEAIDAISLTTKQIKTYCRILLNDDSSAFKLFFSDRRFGCLPTDDQSSYQSQVAFLRTDPSRYSHIRAILSFQSL